MCCAGFTKQQRKPVQCLYCSYTACAACVQQYVLSVPRDAACMSCARPWNREFLASSLPRTWLHGAYKEHRERVLLEREIAMLPSSQALVENYRTAKELEQELHELEVEYAELHLRIRTINLESVHMRARVRNLSANNYQGTGGAASTAERRTFVRACPADGCRGFLSTAWKCGVCAVYVCKDCHEIKGQERDAGNAAHRCDPGNVATAALLARDTKPCPKCAAMIYKIEGCNQMFCTSCNTAFCWRTGQIVTNGQIHNPHYYEFLRRTNGGEAPRNAGDVPCGGLCGTWELNNKLRTLRPLEAESRLLHEFHRTARHVQAIDMHRLAGYFNINDHADLRLRYLLKEIDQDQWKRKLQQREKKREKDVAMRQVYEMYTTAVAETFRKLLAGMDDVKTALNELELVLKFANDSLADIERSFNMSARHIHVNRGETSSR